MVVFLHTFLFFLFVDSIRPLFWGKLAGKFGMGVRNDRVEL